MVCIHVKIQKYSSLHRLGDRSPVVSTLSPTATSVTINWTQPEFSLPVVGYTVKVTRVFEFGQVHCPSFENEQSTTTSPNVTTATVSDLQEFSSYLVTVLATFRVFRVITPMATGMGMFTSLSSGK